MASEFSKVILISRRLEPCLQMIFNLGFYMQFKKQTNKKKLFPSFLSKQAREENVLKHSKGINQKPRKRKTWDLGTQVILHRRVIIQEGQLVQIGTDHKAP